MRLALPALWLCAGCATASSSAWTPGPPPPPAPAPARVVFLAEPTGADPTGAVEAHGSTPGATLQEVVAELASRGASIGADLVRVDGFATRYEMIEVTHAYDCGTDVTTTEPQTVTTIGADGRVETHTDLVTVTRHEPRTCTETRQVEVPTLTLVGRAFRTRGGSP